MDRDYYNLSLFEIYYNHPGKRFLPSFVEAVRPKQPRSPRVNTQSYALRYGSSGLGNYYRDTINVFSDTHQGSSRSTWNLSTIGLD